MTNAHWQVMQSVEDAFSKTSMVDFLFSEDVRFKMENRKLEQVKEFTYLGSVISDDEKCNTDIKRRIGLTSAVIGRLHKIWKFINGEHDFLLFCEIEHLPKGGFPVGKAKIHADVRQTWLHNSGKFLKQHVGGAFMRHPVDGVLWDAFMQPVGDQRRFPNPSSAIQDEHLRLIPLIHVR